MIIGGLSYPSSNHGILGTSGMQNVRNDKMINKWELSAMKELPIPSILIANLLNLIF